MKCYLCSQLASIKHQGHTGYQASQSYDIYHCTACETAFVSPLSVDPSVYDLIYHQIQDVPGYERYLRYANQVLKEKDPLDYLSQSEDMYWSIQKHLHQYPHKKFNILEVGCGFGYLTYALVQAGHQVLGIDISEVAIHQACERYGPYFICADVQDFAKRGPTYDVIIATEVIEHIQNPTHFFQALKSLLLPGGNLLVTTPNKTPYPADILWETEPPPVHLWWFSEQSMKTLAHQLNLSLSFIDFTGFNLKEVDLYGDYTKPYVQTAHFQPSRLPRLATDGSILKQGHRVPLPVPPPVKPTPSISSPPPSPLIKGVKQWIKHAFIYFHLLAPYDKWKEKRRLKQEQRRIQRQIKAEQKRRRQLKKHLKKHPQPRPTLCAVFHKK